MLSIRYIVYQFIVMFLYNFKFNFSIRKRRKLKDYINVKNHIGSQYILNGVKGIKLKRKRIENCNYIIGLTKNQMLNLLTHLGYKKKKWLKAYSLYIYMVRNGIIIFNIDYIQILLNRALRFLERVLFYEGKVFSISQFVNVGFKGLAEYFFNKLNFGSYDGVFQGGLVSNFFHIRKTKKKIKKPYEFRSSFFRFESRLPSIFLIFDTKEFFGCLKESSYVGVPALSIVDSDVDYRDALYPVVGNSDNIFFNIYILLFVKFLIDNLHRVRFMKYLKLFLRLIYFYLKYRVLIALLRVKKFSLVSRYLSKFKNLKFRLKTINIGRCFKVILNEQRFFPRVDIYSYLAFSLRKRALFLKLFLRRFRYKKYRLRIFWFWYFSRKYDFSKKKLFPFRHFGFDTNYKKYHKWMHKSTNKFVRFLFRPRFILANAVYKKILSVYFARRKFTGRMLKSFILHKYGKNRWVPDGFRLFFSRIMPKVFHIYAFVFEKLIHNIFLGKNSIFFKKKKFIFFNFRKEPDLYFEFKKKYDMYKKDRRKLLAYRKKVLLPHRHNKKMALITRWLVTKRRGITSRIKKHRKLVVLKYVHRKRKSKSLLRKLVSSKALNRRKWNLNRERAVRFGSAYFINFLYMQFLFIFNNYRFWSYTLQTFSLPAGFEVNRLSEFSFVRNIGRLFHQASLFKYQSVEDSFRKALINHALLALAKRRRNYLVNTRICWRGSLFYKYVHRFKKKTTRLRRYVLYYGKRKHKRRKLVRLFKRKYRYTRRIKRRTRRFRNVRYFFGKKGRTNFNTFDFFKKYYDYALYSIISLSAELDIKGISFEWHVSDLFYKVFFKSVKDRMDRVRLLFLYQGFANVISVLNDDPFWEYSHVYFYILRRALYDLYIQSIVGYIYTRRVAYAFKQIERFHLQRFRESYDEYQPLTKLYDRNSSFFQKGKKVNFWKNKFRDRLTLNQWFPILRPFMISGKKKKEINEDLLRKSINIDFMVYHMCTIGQYVS